MPERAVIFANGEIKDRDRLRSILRPDDLLIAADGGLHHLIELDLSPSFLIGDLDSVTPEQVRTVKELGGQVIRFSKDKNETDLQLAMDHALSLGCTEIVIVAALGGRLDQILGNIFLLDRVDLVPCSIRLDDGVEEVFLIRDSALITGSAGDIVSLLPLNGPVYDVKTEDLKYPLVYEKLFPDRTRGISNVMTTDRARVSISRGTLICIHTRH
ncbi:MAG: thiamine diphosphokinase [Leptolinea sp.]|jgi:thiamine pyrophosphokinase|nr:thiamine diphosphokinase [Leptolinea sp.]